MRTLKVMLAIVVIAFGSMTSIAASAAPPPGRVYLALGDSLPASFQPNGDLHDGYAEQLFQAEQANIPDLRLLKLACPGERTNTIDRPRHLCPYPAGTQLDQAVAVLQSREIAFVTLQIGANDFIRCFRFGPAAFDQACVDAVLPRISERLTTIVQTLQTAAPGVTIVGATYYDPLLVAALFGADPATVAAIADGWGSFNDALEQTYGTLGVPVADIETSFSSTDFDTIVHVRGMGDIPINLARVCQWTYGCRARFDYDLHPNTVGYAVMARTFEATVEAALGP